jgi:hypothetical protein
MKWLKGLKLLFDLIFTAIVLHVFLLALISVFCCISKIPNPVLRVDSFSIAMQFWSS